MKILIILGHPSQKRQSFCAALAAAYSQGAAGGGHEVQLYKIADKRFDPILHEGYAEEQAAEPDIMDAREKILWADHLVFIYPLWQFNFPGLLKCFLERTLTKGFAFEIVQAGSQYTKKLAGKSARLIQTSGMPSFIYRFWFAAHGMKALRDMLNFCGIRTVRTSCYGMIEAVDDTRRKQWLNEVVALGAQGK